VRKAVVGNHIKPFNAGKGAFRFLIPKQQLFDHPATRQLVSKPGYMTFWYANDRRLVMYPCDDNTTMNFIAMHPYELSASEAYGERTQSFTFLSREYAMLTLTYKQVSAIEGARKHYCECIKTSAQ
jgi:hypothetical protein